MSGTAKQWVLIGLLELTSTVGWTQSVCRTALTGRVLGPPNEAPLAGATVRLRQTGLGATTDAGGYFRLDALCPGQYVVEYQSVGYQSVVIPLTVGPDSIIRLEPVRLVPDAQTLQEVTVTEQRSEAGQLLQLQTALTGNALDATRGQSLGESLKTLPGLYSIQTGPSISKPVIHGLYSNRILMLNNGVRQEDQQWGSEHAPQIDPFGAARLTVIKGAASVRYGSDAIGGVILVEPNVLPTRPGLGGALNMIGGTNGRAVTASGLVEGAFGRQLTGLSGRVQGTFKRVGYAKTPRYYLENSSYRETNGSATLSYTRRVGNGGRAGADVFFSRFATQVGLFRGAQVGSLADLYAAIARPEPLRQPGFSYALDRPYQDVTHDLLKAKAFVRSNRWGTVTTTFARQQNVRQEYDVLAFSRATTPELYLKLVTQTIDVVWEHPVRKHPVQKYPVRKHLSPQSTRNESPGAGWFSGSVGFNGITQGNVRRFLFLIPNYRTHGAGLFALERYVRNRWTLEGGIRYDYRWLRAFFRNESTNEITSRTRDWQNVSGSLGAVYQLSRQLTLTGNLSTAWRAPNVSDLYADGLHQSAVAYERGNPNLGPEQASNANLSVQYAGNRLSADLDLFNNRIDNYIYLKPDSLPLVRQRGAFPAYSYDQVRATFRGIDATIRYRLTNRLTLTSKTALLWAFDRTNRDYLVAIPPNRTDNGLRYDLADKGRVSGLYVSVSGQYVARQNRAPAVTQRFAGEQLIFTGDFAPPPAAYTLLGAELGLTWRIGGQPVHVNLTGTNLLNRAYRDYLNRFRYFADEPGRNLLLKLKLPFTVART